MKNVNRISFGNPLIKQGNSYSLRIPKMAVDTLNLKEGDKVKIILSKPQKVFFSNEKINNIVKECRKIKKISKFSSEKITIFLSLMNYIINQRMSQNEKTLEKINRYEKELTKQFGKKFMEDYKYFIRILEENKSVSSVFKNP